MSIETIWKVLAALCNVFRWFNRRKPHRGVFLIVEDDAMDAAILQRLLKKRGWHSEVATSAETAAGLVAHTYYPAVFIDMRLPGMPGSALVRVLSDNHPETNIVIVCGEPADLAKIEPSQFVCLIRKPPTLEAIEDVLNKLKL